VTELRVGDRVQASTDRSYATGCIVEWNIDAVRIVEHDGHTAWWDYSCVTRTPGWPVLRHPTAWRALRAAAETARIAESVSLLHHASTGGDSCFHAHAQAIRDAIRTALRAAGQPVRTAS